MRRRIRDKCYERLASRYHDQESQDDWLRLLREIEAARVSTIHAFCASLLRAPRRRGRPRPDVRRARTGRGRRARKRSDRRRAPRRGSPTSTPDTLDLAASSGLSKLKEQLRELLRHRHDAGLPRVARRRRADELVAAWQDSATTATHSRPPSPSWPPSPDVRAIAELLQSVTPPPNKDKFVEAKAQLLELLPRLGSGRSGRSTTCRRSASVRRRADGICTAKDWPHAGSVRRAYRDACKRFRDALDKRTPLPFDRRGRPRSRRARPQAAASSRTTWPSEYDARKGPRKASSISTTCLSRAYRLLTDPEHAALRERLSSDLRLLLVDEFQDTDPLQVELVKALCGDVAAGKLFFVGDFKQSIYRFRGAQPDVFLDLHANSARAGPAAADARISAASRPFCTSSTRCSCTRSATTTSRCAPTARKSPPSRRSSFSGRSRRDKNSQGQAASSDAREQEARRIARRLRELIDSGEPIIADARRRRRQAAAASSATSPSCSAR